MNKINIKEFKNEMSCIAKKQLSIDHVSYLRLSTCFYQSTLNMSDGQLKFVVTTDE